MATFKSDKAQAAAARRYLETGLVIEHATYTGSATLSAGDVIQMVKVPAGARGHSFTLSWDEQDTAGLSLGDGLDPDRYMAATTYAAGGITHGGAAATHTPHGYEYSANDTVDITVTAAPAAGTAAPVFRLTFAYFCDN